jgi:hypothetical protein
VCSIAAVAYNYYAGHISAGKAGTALGVICALLGTTAGAMGAFGQRIKRAKARMAARRSAARPI